MNPATEGIYDDSNSSTCGLRYFTCLLTQRRGEFYDYLRPAVLLSLNTGIRRNTLFNLVWGDVDFSTQTLMQRGEISKNGENARIPLNDDAADIFSSWREQSPNT
jgi:integrase